MAKQKYYQRPDGLYEAIRTINGKRKAFRGKTCREVDRKILEYQKEQEMGRTVIAVADEWMERREPELADASRKAYFYSVKRLKEELGGEAVKDVKPIQLERMLLRMKERGAKQGTVKTMKSVLRQIFRHAVIQGDIDVSPAAELELPRGLTHDKRSSLPPDKIKAVLEYRGDWYLLGLFLLLTGCRIGEILALRYEDIDRKEKVIHVNKKISYALSNRPVIEDHTKTESGMRNVPLLSILEAEIPKGHVGLIFHEEDGEPLRKSRFSAAFKTLCDGAGLVEFETVTRGSATFQRPIYPYSAHWFRHTFATICFDAGLDPKSTAFILGHSSEQITKEIYTHITKNRENADAEKLETFVKTMA